MSSEEQEHDCGKSYQYGIVERRSKSLQMKEVQYVTKELPLFGVTGNTVGIGNFRRTWLGVQPKL